MRTFSLFVLLVVIGINAKGFLKFKSETLQTFNGARRLLASGSLKTLIDVVNEIGKNLNAVVGQIFPPVPEFGPAANMHKLKWSPKLEHVAFEYLDTKGEFDMKGTRDIHYEGFEGFEWKGAILELVMSLLKIIPLEKLKLVLMPILNILDKFLTALLLMLNYPSEEPMNPISKNLGATQALFAHRYEIGCYTKMLYSACFMEPSRNGGWLYQPGVPCTNCTTYCEFNEDNNGVIEEGDLCEAPPDESNSTATFAVPKTDLKSDGRSTTYSLLSVGISLVLLAHQHTVN